MRKKIDGFHAFLIAFTLLLTMMIVYNYSEIYTLKKQNNETIETFIKNNVLTDTIQKDYLLYLRSGKDSVTVRVIGVNY